MADAMMMFLGEAHGVNWYWAQPGEFENPGAYYWDGARNVLCVPHLSAPEAPAQAEQVAESMPLMVAQALEALDELEAAARGDEPFNHFAAPLIRQTLKHYMLAAAPEAPAQAVDELAAIEREHLGDPDTQTGIYAPVPPQWREAMKVALRDGLSVCASVSTGRDRKVVRDGSVLFLQTQEWCEWAENEVGPKLRAALAQLDAIAAAPEAPAQASAVDERDRKDAERYRFIRNADRSDPHLPYQALMAYACESFDEAIDDAMEEEARAALAQKGGAS